MGHPDHRKRRAGPVRGAVLVEAIIVMAHKLGIKVVAEGVETEEQRKMLVGAGCDFGQGYLFARPMPAEDFDRYLDSFIAA